MDQDSKKNVQYGALRGIAIFRQIDAADTRQVIAAAYAAHLSRELVLPSAEVASMDAHYEEFVAPLVAERINTVNESLMLSVSHCMEYTKALWLARYTAAYPKVFVYTTGCQYDFFCEYFGIGLFVSPDSYAFLTKYREKIFFLANSIHELECAQGA